MPFFFSLGIKKKREKVGKKTEHIWICIFSAQCRFYAPTKIRFSPVIPPPFRLSGKDNAVSVQTDLYIIKKSCKSQTLVRYQPNNIRSRAALNCDLLSVKLVTENC